MQPVTGSPTNGLPMPPGVTPITDLKNQKRASKTLSKAVGLHLEGKLESAARLLSKAIEDGERELGLYAALGHIQYEMRDYAAAACTYAQLAEADPKHRTAFFNLGVCHGNLKQWHDAADAFRRASADRRHPLRCAARSGHRADPRWRAQARPSSRSINTSASSPNHEQALFGNAVALQQTGKHAEAVEQYRKVLARNPKCEEALSNLVAMFLEKKDPESVRRYAEMLGELQPDSPVATEALATLAFQDGDYVTAARHCRTLARNPARPLRKLVQPRRCLSQDGQL